MGKPSSDTAGIRQVIRALRKAGYVLDSVNNGGDDDETVTNESQAIDEITATDSAWLYVKDTNGKLHGVLFVLGNDPEEVVCDYYVSLEDVIGPLTDSWWD